MVIRHSSFVISFLLGLGTASAAPPIITAKDYSGFMRGNGYAWPDYVAPSNLGAIRVERTTTHVLLIWSDRAMLQAAGLLSGFWADVPGASSPHELKLGAMPELGQMSAFYQVRGIAGVHPGVGAGCPQQGFDFTGLPADHWANHPATATQCGWIVPELLTGFADVPSGGLVEAFVRVVLRSFSVSNNWTWWNGSPLTEEDDALHQNEGWFHFRVRHPAPTGMGDQYRLRFELAFDNPYAFPSGPMQLNWWWVVHTWDWEPREGRHIFTPMFRVKDRSGTVGPWQHIADTNAHPTAGHIVDQRHHRCLFEQRTPATPWTEIEVAQNLPCTLDDRARFLRFIQTNYPPQHPDLCIRKRHLGYGGLFPSATEPSQPYGEINELYAIEIFKRVPGSDGEGGSIVALLDYQNDLCPHPNRWQQANSFFPPIWGFIFYSDTGQSNAAIRFLANLRQELPHPNTGRYVRDPATPQGWFKVRRSNYGIPLWLLFEFDAAALYSHIPGPPGGWHGHFASPIQLPGTNGGPTFYVHGYIDQVGQATASDGDPAHVFKLFGRDIIDAVRRELLPTSSRL